MSRCRNHQSKRAHTGHVQAVHSETATLEELTAALAQVLNPAMVQALLIVLHEMPPEQWPAITVIVDREEQE